MLNTTNVALASMSLLLGATAASSSPDVAGLLKTRLPKTEVTGVDCNRIAGLCEVTAKENLFYVDASARYLIIGRVYDMETRQDLTAARLLELNPDMLVGGAAIPPAADPVHPIHSAFAQNADAGREADTGGAAAPMAPSKTTRPAQRRKGLPPTAFLFAGLAVAALLWGAWVTKNILDPAVVKAPIASVRLEQIIGEYVQAQARSNTPPEIVTQQTQAFMAALGEELKARGADGTTVMVGEAVLSQNVPDITAEVRSAIYAKVPPPAARAAAAPPPSFAPPQQIPAGPGPMPAMGQ